MKLKVTKFNENLLHVRNGEVVLYKREDSTNWQARYKLKDLKWHRVATKQKNLQYAAETACEAYDRARFLFAENIPISSKRFDVAANLAVDEMRRLAFPQFSRHLIISKLNWRESHEENEIYV